MFFFSRFHSLAPVSSTAAAAAAAGASLTPPLPLPPPPSLSSLTLCSSSPLATCALNRTPRSSASSSPASSAGGTPPTRVPGGSRGCGTAPIDASEGGARRHTGSVRAACAEGSPREQLRWLRSARMRSHARKRRGGLDTVKAATGHASTFGGVHNALTRDPSVSKTRFKPQTECGTCGAFGSDLADARLRLCTVPIVGYNRICLFAPHCLPKGPTPHSQGSSWRDGFLLWTSNTRITIHTYIIYLCTHPNHAEASSNDEKPGESNFDTHPILTPVFQLKGPCP